MKKILFSVLLVLIPVVFISSVLFLARDYLSRALHPFLVPYIADSLSEEQRRAIYREISSIGGGFFDVSPNPDIARLAQPDVTVTFKQAEVVTNRAGMRSKRDYDTKQEDMFRIVCLGDSYVFGTGGPEEDRFCNQLEDYYRDNDITVDGKPIETLAIGLGSWTMLQQAAYLSTKLSDIAPDIILVLSIGNDFRDNSGVTGKGFDTLRFSPSNRQWGNGVFHDKVSRIFGLYTPSFLRSDISYTPVTMWESQFQALQDLTRLQQKRGKHILHSLLSARVGEDKRSYSEELYKKYLHQFEIGAPFLIVSILGSPETRLAHDSHPNRLGHRHLTNQYIHAMHQLDWVDTGDARVAIDEKLQIEFNPPVNEENLIDRRRQLIDKRIHSAIDFGNLQAELSRSFLGGIFPADDGSEEDREYPWASVRSGFFMKQPSKDANRLSIEISVPDKIELFPMQITMEINGIDVGRFAVDEDLAGKRFTLEAKVPEHDYPALDVVLYADKHFSTLVDHTMKSFRLVSARIR